MARHTSSPQRDFVGLGDEGPVARAAQEISAVPDFAIAASSSGVREGKLEDILRILAEELPARGKSQLEEYL